MGNSTGNGADFRFQAPEWHVSLDSTNVYLRKLAASSPDLSPGTVVAAMEQTAGRGRMGKSWLSVSGRDLTFSFFWKGTTPPGGLPFLTMAAALGVVDYLASQRVAAKVKWPNDVMAGDAKICGILTETWTVEKGAAAITGVGLNLGVGRALSSDMAVASVGGLDGKERDPRSELPALLEWIRPWVTVWEGGAVDALREAWEANAWGMGKRASVETSRGLVHGKIIGLGNGGELLLEDEGGVVARIAGAARLRLSGSCG